MAVALVAGCGSDSTIGRDATSDSRGLDAASGGDGGDARADAVADLRSDAGADGRADASPDAAAPDAAGADVTPDAPLDAAADAAPASSADAPVDLAAEGGGAGDLVADAAGTFLALNPCSAESSYITTTTTVEFRVNDTPGYSPPCLKVPRGTQVTFTGTTGDFTAHPLRPRSDGSPGNPITPASAGTSAAVTFPTAGFFPYECQAHADKMFGVVWVTD